jgi:hypothetical protein
MRRHWSHLHPLRLPLVPPGKSRDNSPPIKRGRCYSTLKLGVRSCSARDLLLGVTGLLGCTVPLVLELCGSALSYSAWAKHSRDRSRSGNKNATKRTIGEAETVSPEERNTTALFKRTPIVSVCPPTHRSSSMLQSHQGNKSRLCNGRSGEGEKGLLMDGQCGTSVEGPLTARVEPGVGG